MKPDHVTEKSRREQDQQLVAVVETRKILERFFPDVQPKKVEEQARQKPGSNDNA